MMNRYFAGPHDQAWARQTATNEILVSLSGSMTDTKPVFDAIVRNLLRLFGTKYATVQLLHDGMIRMAALDGEQGFENLAARYPVPLNDRGVNGRVILSYQVVQIAPIVGNPASPPFTEQSARDFGYNSIIAAPMVLEGKVIGAVGTARREPRSFDDKQVALIKAFANQAVIAITNTRLVSELRESLDRQTATSEVLEAISKSQGDLEPVFEKMLGNAIRICEAQLGNLFLREADVFRAVAAHGTSAYVEFWKTNPLIIERDPDVPLARLAQRQEIVHILDLKSDPSYVDGNRRIVALVDSAGARTLLLVPMLKQGELIGAIGIYRQEVRPFTDKQIALLASFASQAVIAIENARLLNELRESLDRQTATSEVLKIISSSQGQLEPVFRAIIANATRLCEAQIGALWLSEADGYYRQVAHQGYSPAFSEYMARNPVFQPSSDSPLGLVARTKRLLQVPDMREQSDYISCFPPIVALVDVGGARTLLEVPLLKDDTLIGAIGIFRQQVRTFEEKHIEVVQNFSEQAVIAIENARLLQELQDKGHQLEIASQHKSQFLANMSHELRTPLNAILGYTELILDSIYGEPTEKMRGVLERLQANGKHLLNLINDVLDLSKIEAGQLTLDLGDYSLKDVVHTVVTAVEPLATGKALALTAEVGQDLSIGHGDGRRLAQVLLNLVGNAIKFTDQGQVTIRASAADGLFTVAVCDTGPGIAASDREAIPGVPTSRQHHHKTKRWHRTRPRDLEAHYRDARRSHLAEVGNWERLYVHIYRPCTRATTGSRQWLVAS